MVILRKEAMVMLTLTKTVFYCPEGDMKQTKDVVKKMSIMHARVKIRYDYESF